MGAESVVSENREEHTITISPEENDQNKMIPLPVPVSSGFNSEEFLARVNMNAKLNNILRSPTKTPSGIRQRSLFTATATSSSVRLVFCLS